MEAPVAPGREGSGPAGESLSPPGSPENHQLFQETESKPGIAEGV